MTCSLRRAGWAASPHRRPLSPVSDLANIKDRTGRDRQWAGSSHVMPAVLGWPCVLQTWRKWKTASFPGGASLVVWKLQGPPSCKILDRSSAPHWPLLGALSQLCFVPRGHLHRGLTSLLWLLLLSVGAGSPHRAARSPASFLRHSWHLDGLADEGQKLWAPRPPDWCPTAWDSQRSPLPRRPHHIPLFPPGSAATEFSAAWSLATASGNVASVFLERF